MQVIIDHTKFSEVFFDNQYLPTGTPLDMELGDILRLQSRHPVRFVKTDKPYDPAHWNTTKTVGFTGAVDSESGWGNVSYNLLKFSPKIDFRWFGTLKGVPDAVLTRVKDKSIPLDGGMIYHDQPKDYWLDKCFPRTLAILPFETTQVPASWVPKINAMDAVFVPCAQNTGMMKNSGVNIPVELIHWGIDPTQFSELERPDDGIFTFGALGALAKRKGVDLLVDAFSKAFPRSQKDVQMILKTSFSHFQFWNRDPRIIIDMTPVPHDELIERFFKKVDCFVYPTRGEGFGLTPLEAMATGIPAITTGWSGPTEYNNNEVGWILDFSMVAADDFSKLVYKEYCGEWAEPSLDHLIYLLRYCYEHQDEVKEKGKKAAEYVRQNWLWEQQIHLFHDLLDRYLTK